jgi:succinyl-diaminopimelate desuccinylase
MRLTPAARLLRDLIAIPSVSPADDPGTDRTGEKALAEFLAGWLRQRGATVRLLPVEPGRPNLHAHWPAKTRKPRRILFCPHLDTVSVAGMTIDPFRATVRNGRLYGRGASDTKGPMAAMLTALEQTLRDGPPPGWELHFAATMGEETGCLGARTFARQCPRYDLVIVGEPTGLRLVHAHLGCIWLELETRGRDSHASISKTSDSAIAAMAPWIHALETRLPSELAAFSDPDLGPPRSRVTLIRGGSKANICPGHCTATMDVRTTPRLSRGALLRAIRACAPPDAPPPTTRILLESAPLKNRAGDPLIDLAIRASRGPATAPWFCDASVFRSAGMPAAALGPGSIAQAHTKDEWISLSQLDAGVSVYRRLIASLPSS